MAPKRAFDLLILALVVVFIAVLSASLLGQTCAKDLDICTADAGDVNAACHAACADEFLAVAEPCFQSFKACLPLESLRRWHVCQTGPVRDKFYLIRYVDRGTYWEQRIVDVGWPAECRLHVDRDGDGDADLRDWWRLTNE